MKVQIQKWGNSLALRIPKSFAQMSGIDRGTSLELSLQDGNLVLRPAKITLESLLDQITQENIHGEVFTGKPLGKETW